MLIEKKFDEENNLWNVELYGDIDLYNASEFKNELAKITGGDICLHCEHLKYIDSTGLGVLVSVLKECQRKNHSVTIKGLKLHIYRIFELTNLHKIFKIEVPAQ